ncbi:alpha/beta fold hydrolase, partial [Streptomyces cellulosae]
MRTAAALVAAGSLLLTTPVRPSPSASTSSSSSSSASEARGTAVAAARAASEGIDFGPCAEEQELPPSVECGTLRVPLDYTRPDGEQIRLTVSRSRATGEDPATGRAVPRQGSLVNNPGGPGVSGMYFPMLGVVPGWKRLAAAYDLVGYAPRGVGRSAPLSCTDPKTFHQGPAPAPPHPTAAVKRERAARAAAYARGCAERAGDALQHYTSLNNARDLDVLRAALGETRLTFLGSSYGTYIGALYATLFPSHVRRMVFDSAVNPAPERIWYRNNLAQSAAFEDRWADFRAWAARHHDVYGLGDTARKV